MKIFSHLEMAATLLLGVACAAAPAGGANRNDDTNAVAQLRAKAIADLSGYTTPQLFDALKSKSVKMVQAGSFGQRVGKTPPGGSTAESLAHPLCPRPQAGGVPGPKQF
jgi:hypothetical protein